MRLEQRQPAASLKQYVKSYWWIDSEGDKSIHQQKIVPDGYPEVIFHYGDNYEVNITGDWQRQDKLLLAGQIRNHFFIQNTGLSGMIGIKMQPTALNELFGIDMSTLVDKVLTIDQKVSSSLHQMVSTLSNDFNGSIAAVENYLHELIQNKEFVKTYVCEAVNTILDKKGAIKISDLLNVAQVTERQLERSFKVAVGLSPKFYSRIIRFTHIFEHVQNSKDWTGITFDTGYYDQAHFIKNFKEFTGESPAEYGFDENNIANFFLFKGG